MSRILKMSSKRNVSELQAPRARVISDGYIGTPRSYPITSAPLSGTDFAANPSANDNDFNRKSTPDDGETGKKNIKNQSIVHSGLTILPWEKFIYDPRSLKDLFHLDKDGVINYDPQEVNVFFHATRMMRPSFGDVMENGQSWILTVERVSELEQIRAWITECVSVFGVTLVKTTGVCGETDSAPCLVVFDPTDGTLRDRIYHAFTKSVTAMEQGRLFSIEYLLLPPQADGSLSTAIHERNRVLNNTLRNVQSLAEVPQALPKVADTVTACEHRSKISDNCSIREYLVNRQAKINLNGCVENWCSRIKKTRCQAVGAKLIVTNGEDRDTCWNVDNMLCRVVCFPVWAIQTGVTQIYRRLKYEDYILDFSAEELCLHGPKGDVKNQMDTLFEGQRKDVFRTKPAEKGLVQMDPRASGQVEGHKYICVKTYDGRPGRERPTYEDEYETDGLQKLLSHIKPQNTSSHMNNANTVSHKRGIAFPEKETNVDENLTDDGKIVKQSVRRNMNNFSNAGFIKTGVLVHASENPINNTDKNKADDKFATSKQRKYKSHEYQLSHNVETSSRHFRDEKVDVKENKLFKENITNTKVSELDEAGMETILFKGYSRKVLSSDDFEDSNEIYKFKNKNQKRQKLNNRPQSNKTKRVISGERNNAFLDDKENNHKKTTNDRVYDESSDEYKGFKICDTNAQCLTHGSDEEIKRIPQYDTYFNCTQQNQKPKKESSDDELADDHQSGQTPITEDNTFKEFHYPKVLQSQDDELVLRRKGPLFMPDDDMFQGKATNVIRVDKTDKTCLIDNTDDELDESDDTEEKGNEGDIELTDCDLDDDFDYDSDDKAKEKSKEGELDSVAKNTDPLPRPKSRNTRKALRYDSTRKYLGIQMRKKQKPN